MSAPILWSRSNYVSEEDIEDTMSRLEKVGTGLASQMETAVQDVKRTVSYAQSAGVTRKIFFHPLMLGSHHTHFKDGVMVEVVRRNKPTDVLAAGGRCVCSLLFKHIVVDSLWQL